MLVVVSVALLGLATTVDGEAAYVWSDCLYGRRARPILGMDLVIEELIQVFRGMTGPSQWHDNTTKRQAQAAIM
jgi:hypothetical protein